MRLFKLVAFKHFADKESISDADLRILVAQLHTNPTKGSLGGMVHKLRLAREGAGVSSGYRVLLFFRIGDKIIFAHAFSKSDKKNITQREKNTLKEQAKVYMRLDDAQIASLLAQGRLFEIL